MTFGQILKVVVTFAFFILNAKGPKAKSFCLITGFFFHNRIIKPKILKEEEKTFHQVRLGQLREWPLG